MSYYFYTETAFHHEGDIEYLKKMIDASFELGVDGVKFQVLVDYDELIGSKHPAYHIFKKALISEEDWVDVLNYCFSKSLDVIFMPCDSKALEMVEKKKVSPKYFDIHSVSFYDQEILNRIKNLQIPVILGVGGRYFEEIQEKVFFFKDQLDTIMMGFQSFPTRLENLKIEKIRLLKERFPKIRIGYADHSSQGSKDSIYSNDCAYLLGARVFEKHITISPKEERFDWQSASIPTDIKEILERLNRLDSEILNKSEEELHQLNSDEVSYRMREKVAMAKYRLEKGTVLNSSNVVFKMSGIEGGYGKIEPLLNKKLNKVLEVDELITDSVLKN